MMGRALPTGLGDVALMAGEVREMLYQALSAFAQRDLALAREVAAADDRVDLFYERANETLLEPGKDLAMWDHRLRLLRTAHHLERMGDRVVNICEWVHYVVTGELLELA
jgi:phosphate transport system protein